MRRVCQLLAFCGLFVCAHYAHAACTEQDLDGVAALAEARAARGVLSDLQFMRAWRRTIAHEMAEHRLQNEDMADLDEIGVRNATSWFRWSDTYTGFELCASQTPEKLDRRWWGAYGEFTDDRSGLSYELFYLRATDKLDLGAPFEDVDYGWTHRVAGAQISYRDWFALRLGTVDIEAPSRIGSGEHEGSVILAAGVPRLGLWADLLVHPGTRSLNMLALAVRRRPLPIVGVSASAHGGWLSVEERAVLGLGVWALRDALHAEVTIEGLPIRLRSVSTRIENQFRTEVGSDADMGVAPFLEVSMYNSAAFERLSGRSLVPGASTGARLFFNFGVLATGFEGFVGVNRAAELSRLNRVADHMQWGTRVFVRLGL